MIKLDCRPQLVIVCLQEDLVQLDKKTVLYQEQVARTRSGILNVFLGKRGGEISNPHNKTLQPQNVEHSRNNKQSRAGSSTISIDL